MTPREALDAIERLLHPDWPKGARRRDTPAQILRAVSSLQQRAARLEKNEIRRAVCCHTHELACRDLLTALRLLVGRPGAGFTPPHTSEDFNRAREILASVEAALAQVGAP